MQFDAKDLLEAVKRERERCAKIAENMGKHSHGEIYIARLIADEIRKNIEIEN
jgi:hypothetical protein